MTELVEDAPSPGAYLDHIREQIDATPSKEGALSSAHANNVHAERDVVFCNFYAHALSVPDDYLQVLKIADLDPREADAEMTGVDAKKCKNVDNIVYYPRYDAGDLNPLHDYANIQERTSRAVGDLFDMVDMNRVTFLKLTFPEDISTAFRFAQDREDFEDRVWATFKTFKEKLQVRKTEDGRHMGMHVNFHPWSTSTPFDSHLHFHIAVPMLTAPYVTQEDRDKVLNSGHVARLKQQYEDLPADHELRGELKRMINIQLRKKLGIQRLPDYSYGKPFDADLIRALWRESLEQHWPEFMDDMDAEDDVNIHLSWEEKLSSPAQITHKFRYKARKPSIDFFRYYIMNDISMQEFHRADWIRYLFDYSNRARCYGIMKWKKNLHVFDSAGRSLRCPICGGETEDVDVVDYENAEVPYYIQEYHYGYSAHPPPGGTSFYV